MGKRRPTFYSPTATQALAAERLFLGRRRVQGLLRRLLRGTMARDPNVRGRGLATLPAEPMALIHVLTGGKPNGQAVDVERLAQRLNTDAKDLLTLTGIVTEITGTDDGGVDTLEFQRWLKVVIHQRRTFHRFDEVKRIDDKPGARLLDTHPVGTPHPDTLADNASESRTLQDPRQPKPKERGWTYTSHIAPILDSKGVATGKTKLVFTRERTSKVRRRKANTVDIPGF